jgi:hypothetical protein
MNPMQDPMHPAMGMTGMEEAPEMEDEIDPALQEKYEDAHHAMNLIVDEKKVFDRFRSSLVNAQKRGSMIEESAQMIVHVLGRLEKDTGPLEEEILMTLGEDLVVGIRERFGIEVSDDELQKILATAVGLWMKDNEDRVQVDPEDAAMVERELSGMGAQA